MAKQPQSPSIQEDVVDIIDSIFEDVKTQGEPEEEPENEFDDEEEPEEEPEEEAQEQGAGELPAWINNTLLKAKEIGIEAEEPQEVVEALITEIESLREFQETEQKANELLSEVFNENQEVAVLIQNLVRGKSVAEAVELSGILDIMPEEGDDDYEARVRAKIEKENIAKQRIKRADEIAANTKNSQKEIVGWQSENKVDDGIRDAVLSKADEFVNNALSGKITKDFLKVIHKALIADKEISKAKEAGKIMGRNEKIEAKRKEVRGGDGLPRIGNQNRKVKDGSRTSDTTDFLDAMASQPRSFAERVRMANRKN
jgi:hypothetical protein